MLYLLPYVIYLTGIVQCMCPVMLQTSIAFPAQRECGMNMHDLSGETQNFSFTENVIYVLRDAPCAWCEGRFAVLQQQTPVQQRPQQLVQGNVSSLAFGMDTVQQSATAPRPARPAANANPNFLPLPGQSMRPTIHLALLHVLPACTYVCLIFLSFPYLGTPSSYWNL
jgi:hypothetical protein